jgi:fatty acid-binding protein DegV
MAATVAVVTDSTACLSSDLTVRYGIRVVALRIVVDGVRMDDDPAVMPGGIEAELQGGAAVSTASPAPERFAVAYAAAGRCCMSLTGGSSCSRKSAPDPARCAG